MTDRDKARDAEAEKWRKANFQNWKATVVKTQNPTIAPSKGEFEAGADWQAAQSKNDISKESALTDMYEAWLKATKERDALKADNEKLYAMRGEITKNDARTFGDLMIENEKLKAEKEHWYNEFANLEVSRAICCVQMEEERDALKAELASIQECPTCGYSCMSASATYTFQQTLNPIILERDRAVAMCEALAKELDPECAALADYAKWKEK